MNPEVATAQPERMLTMRSGGWVISLTVLVCICLLTWALLPVFIVTERAPGDGRTLESYGFDYSGLTVPRTLIVPAMLHRDMVPVLDAPSSSAPDDSTPSSQQDNPEAHRWEAMQERNDPRRGKYLVKTDRVIGVTVNGESRAYPISVLNVHEIVNDTLGGEPIAVTYSWPTDSPRVFSRRIGDRVVRFGISGLVYNSNMVMYDRADAELVPDTRPAPSATLYSQLAGSAIAGPGAGPDHAPLTIIPHVFTSWERWRTLVPETTVLDRDIAFLKRYKKADPKQYFIDGKISWPVDPLPSSDMPPLFERVVAVDVGGERRVYPHNLVAGKVDTAGTWKTAQAGHDLVFHMNRDAGTVDVTVANASGGAQAQVDHALWFAWHAMYPNDALAVP